MPKLFLLPIISLFDVHDVAVRDWLNKLDDSTLHDHLEYPFRLERFFPESAQHALSCVEEVHAEILRLIDIIDPQAVFLDISIDFVELENRYNKRLISPIEFWSEYYQISADGGPQAIYCVYIRGIIDKEIRLIESRDHLPLSVIFYGQDIKSRKELIPVYENALEKHDDFLLQTANVINEIGSFRHLPQHLWYSPMQVRQTAISYEETEKFYNELLSRLGGMLKFKIRDYIVKNLREWALQFLIAYEKFLDYKMREDEIKFSNIIEGLSILMAQTEHPSIVIFCGPMHYAGLLSELAKDKRSAVIAIGNIDIAALLDKMKPFTQKNRIMQSSYDIALSILGKEKPGRYATADAVLNPVPGIPHSTLRP